MGTDCVAHYTEQKAHQAQRCIHKRQARQHACKRLCYNSIHLAGDSAQTLDRLPGSSWKRFSDAIEYCMNIFVLMLCCDTTEHAGLRAVHATIRWIVKGETKEN